MSSYFSFIYEDRASSIVTSVMVIYLHLREYLLSETSTSHIKQTMYRLIAAYCCVMCVPAVRELEGH